MVVQQPEGEVGEESFRWWEGRKPAPEIARAYQCIPPLLYSLPGIGWSHGFQLSPANPFTNQILKIIDSLYFTLNWSREVVIHWTTLTPGTHVKLLLKTVVPNCTCQLYDIKKDCRYNQYFLVSFYFITLFLGWIQTFSHQAVIKELWRFCIQTFFTLFQSSGEIRCNDNKGIERL